MKRMAHPMTFDCLPYELGAHMTGKRRPHAHPMTFEERWNLDPDPAGKLAYWAVAIAGGLVGLLVVVAVVVIFG